MARRGNSGRTGRAARWLIGIRGGPARVALLYLAAGGAWIVLSDTFAWEAVAGRGVFQISVVKGLFFVAASAALIFFLVRATLKSILESRETILRMNRALEASSEMYRGISEDYHNRQALLEGLMNAIPDLIFYKDGARRYLGGNRAFHDFLGLPQDAAAGRRDGELLPAAEAELFGRGDEACLERGEMARYEEVVRRGGTVRYLETVKTPFRDAEGRVAGLIGVSRDVTERRLEEERILYISTHDALTGLFNRVHMVEAIWTLDQPEHLPLTVVMGDINGLKLINDSMGHARGDQVIAAAANILRACRREGDVVARTGGDEFTVLMPNSDEADAQAFAEAVRVASQARAAALNELRFASLSLGWATKHAPEDPIDRVRKAAEDAMYRRKIFESRSLHSSILSSIKKTMLEKSDETEAHAERLAALSARLGRALKLPDESLVALELLSTLHDIGKISVDKNLLTKNTPLTEADWREIRKHPEVGYRIAMASPELMHIAEHILSHHERWDGAGYPRGLAGTAIPLLARVLSVVDAFDAMTQDRAYRPAMPLAAALTEIRKNAGTQFDPAVAGAFLDLMQAAQNA